MKISDELKKSFERKQKVQYSLEEFLQYCREDNSYFAGPAERMLKAIGEPEIVDTSLDQKLSRIFLNRTIKVYPAFRDFYGMEETIERIVSYLTAWAQGLEESKQILYLLGPVGGGKSSLAEKLKSLMEQEPVYVLSYKDVISPVFESAFGLINSLEMTENVSKEYNIPRYVMDRFILSPWGVKRLEESNGDLENFKVVKLYPNKLNRICIVKTEPGDENTQDISNLVGKVDIRKLEYYSASDPDCYDFSSGSLCRSNQGLMEFVEMFKAPIKLLHPLLTATQERNFIGTEAMSGIPFLGLLVAHSNESEWQSFKNNKNNSAFLDRICTITVPYCLRVDEEVKIYEKLLQTSKLSESPCAPQTLEMMAQFSILTRLKEHENSNLFSKMKVYNGENIKDTDTRAKSLQEYKDNAGVDEGMTGLSTRFAFKILSSTFNYDVSEVAADPIHLMLILEKSIRREQFPEDEEKRLLNLIKSELSPRFLEFLEKELQVAFIESFDSFAQSIFVKYISLSDSWVQDIDFKDPDTGQLLDREAINNELEKIEKPAQISNPKDFRGEIVAFFLRARAKSGQDPRWNSYEKIKEVIQKKVFSATEDLLPIISFGSKKDSEDDKKHRDFVNRMVKKGYTERQCRRLVDWYLRVKKSS